MTFDPYWKHVVDIANAARKLLDDKPSDQRIAFGGHPGSILNAYREGDATFTEAVEAIRALGEKDRVQIARLAQALLSVTTVLESVNDEHRRWDPKLPEYLRGLVRSTGHNPGHKPSAGGS